MLPFSTLLRISRPRFWHYVLGPMLILFASSGFFEEIQWSFSRWGTDWIFYWIVLLILLGYFMLPANLWIYGRNDIADGDTDKFNKKKGTYESKIDDSHSIKSKLKKSIWIWNIGYILMWSFLISFLMMIADCFPRSVNAYMCDVLITRPWDFTLWLWWLYIIYLWFTLLILLPFFITSYLYSCKPLRAKALPFVDGIMNILYIITPLSIIAWIDRSYSYTIFYLHDVAIYGIAALFRCMAMHCYSAIPDIEADRQAWLNTTAVYLGKQKSLIYCTLLYILATALSFPILGWFSIVAGAIYLAMMLVSYTKKDIFSLYKLFPYINFAVGFSLFRYIILYV